MADTVQDHTVALQWILFAVAVNITVFLGGWMGDIYVSEQVGDDSVIASSAFLPSECLVAANNQQQAISLITVVPLGSTKTWLGRMEDISLHLISLKVKLDLDFDFHYFF